MHKITHIFHIHHTHSTYIPRGHTVPHKPCTNIYPLLCAHTCITHTHQAQTVQPPPTHAFTGTNVIHTWTICTITTLILYTLGAHIHPKHDTHNAHNICKHTPVPWVHPGSEGPWHPPFLPWFLNKASEDLLCCQIEYLTTCFFSSCPGLFPSASGPSASSSSSTTPCHVLIIYSFVSSLVSVVQFKSENWFLVQDESFTTTWPLSNHLTT